MVLPFLKKKEKKEYYIALLFKPRSLGVILFQQDGSKLHILSVHEEKVTEDLEHLPEEELVIAADRVVSFVENTLPGPQESYKTIFSVPSAWSESGRIKKEYLKRLKKVCDELTLTPIGFIVSIEAILHALQRKEGAPLTAIIVEHAQNTLFIYIVKSGSIIETHHSSLSGNAVSTVEHLLKKVERVEVLPARIILFDHARAEFTQQEFLSHHWIGKLPFLHLPQVTILEKGFENESIIGGVATQMGFDVLEEQEAVEERIEEASFDNLGFVKEEDVLASPRHHETEEQDIENIHEPLHSKGHHKETYSEELEKEQETEKYEVRSKKNLLFNMGKVLGFFKSVSVPGRMIVSLGSLILIGAVLIYGYYFYILRATVIVFADKKAFSKEVDVLFSSEESDYSKKVLHMNTVSEETEEKKTYVTTGKKETGEKARGEVTMYNKTDQKKTFEKGTTIKGPNNLELLLLDEVPLASTSAFATTLSSSKAKIEAAKFGQEYNLPSGTNFTFENFSSNTYFAKNDVAFSGGTKKSIKIVSQKDLTEGEKLVLADSQTKIVSEKKSDRGDERILPGVLKYEFLEKTFDKKEDQEADKLTLSAKIKFTLGIYTQDDIAQFAAFLAKDSVPEEFQLIDSESRFDVQNVSIQKDKTAKARVVIQAKYAPKLVQEQIISEIKGKQTASAEKIIKKRSGVSDVNIQMKNRLPLLPEFLPFRAQSITIEIKTNE